MSGSATDRIIRLIRETAAAEPPASPGGRIVVNGDGNVLGDQINIHQVAARPLGRADRRTLRASAINYIRWSCRRRGDPSAWLAFARAEFGVADLDALTDLQLERVRGWCAAQEARP